MGLVLSCKRQDTTNTMASNSSTEEEEERFPPGYEFYRARPAASGFLLFAEDDEEF